MVADQLTIDSSPEVNVRSCFVDYQNLTFPQNRSSEADKLTLTNTEVRSGLGHFRLQFRW